MGYDLIFQQAINFHQNGELDKAEYIYRQILQTAPNKPEVLNLLGLIAQEKNIHNEAVNLFSKAIRQAPHNSIMQFNLAFSLEAMGKKVEAIDAYRKTIQLDSKIKEAYNNIGKIYLSMNNNDIARSFFQKALEIDNNYAEAKAHLAYSYKTENLDKAIELLKETDTHFLPNYYLSLIYKEIKDTDNALLYAQNACEYASDIDYIVENVAEIYLGQNNVNKAKEYLSLTLSINPNNVHAMINMANIMVQEKRYQEAEKNYKKAIVLDENNFDAHLNYAIMLQENKRLHEALEEYRKATVINHNVPEISNNIALILRDLGENKRALDLLFNAIIEKPNKEEFSINAFETMVLMARENKDEVLEVAKQWLKMFPENIFAQRINSILNDKNIDDALFAETLFDTKE